MLVICCGPVGTGCISGSSGITIQAMRYDSNPRHGGMSRRTSHTTRTRVTSRSKYSAKPAHTPAILRLARERTKRLRPIHSTHTSAAVGAQVGIVLNYLSTIVAIHRFPPRYLGYVGLKQKVPFHYSWRYASFMRLRAVSAGAVFTLVATTA